MSVYTWKVLVAVAALATALVPAAVGAQTPTPDTVPALVEATSTTLTIGWEDTEGYDYQIQWRANGASWSNDNILNTVGGIYQLVGLDPDTEYDVRLRWKRQNTDRYPDFPTRFTTFTTRPDTAATRPALGDRTATTLVIVWTCLLYTSPSPRDS